MSSASILSIIVTLLAIGGTPNAVEGNPGGTQGHCGIRDLRDGIALVKGHVSSVNVEEDGVAIQITVDHVFFGTGVGEASIVHGKACRPNVDDIRGRLIFPPPDLDEVGVWAVTVSGTQCDVSGERLDFDGCFPARQDGRWGTLFGRNTFDDGLALAQLVEKVAKANRADCIPILRDSAQSAIPEVSGWSIQALGQVDANQIKEIAADPDKLKALPKCGQVALDQVLCGQITLEQLLVPGNADEAWMISDLRYGMMLRWASDGGSEFEQERIAGRLSVLAQHPNLPMMRVIEALQSLAMNKKATFRVRIWAIGNLGLCVRNSPSNRDAAMRSLADISKNADLATVQDRAKLALKEVERGRS